MIVVVDSNVWWKHLLLRDALSSAFLYWVRQSNSRIGLPEVIEMEVVKNGTKRGLDFIAQIKNNYRQLEILMGKRYDFEVSTAEVVESAVKQWLSNIDDLVVRLPFKFEHARRALIRVNEESPPNSSKNQQFKDSAIWEACLELASLAPVVLVSPDKGFYRGGNYKSGLAAQLAGECQESDRTIDIVQDLAACLELIKAESRHLDSTRIARALLDVIKENTKPLLQKYGYELGGLRSSKLDAFVTPDPSALALSFGFECEAIDVSGDLESEIQPDFVKVLGSVTYKTTDESLSNLRYETIEYYTGGGIRVPDKGLLFMHPEPVEERYGIVHQAAIVRDNPII